MIVVTAAAYGIALTYAGLVGSIAAGVAALDTALLTAQLVRFTYRYLQQRRVILTQIAQQLESL